MIKESRWRRVWVIWWGPKRRLSLTDGDESRKCTSIYLVAQAVGAHLQILTYLPLRGRISAQFFTSRAGNAGAVALRKGPVVSTPL